MKGKMKEAEQHYGKPIEEILPDLFDKYGTQQAVAREIGISQSTLSYWITKLRLKQKTILIKTKSA